jgi:hypothetical protein
MRTAPARSTLIAMSLLMAFGVMLEVGAVELAPDAPETYEVRPGDTLWDIAGLFLRDPWRWSEVWHPNDQIGDPSRIYPGERLRLMRVEGRPRVGRDSAGTRDGMRVVRLSPRVRVTALEAAVPAIPVASIAPFLTQPRIADSDAVSRAPYVVGFPDHRIVAGLGDPIWVRRIDTTAVTEFQILRPGHALRDPETNQILGYEAMLVAHAGLERVGDPAVLKITRTEREVAVGDRLTPAELEAPLENFLPRPAPAGTRGQILSVMDGVSQIGQFDVVILNRGRRERVQPGHVFEVYRGGGQERDRVRDGGVSWNWRRESPLTGEFWLGSDRSVTGWRENEPDPNAPFPPHVEIERDRATFITPFERAGLLMVFRTFDRVSFALVLSAQRSMSVGDQVAPPPS